MDEVLATVRRIIAEDQEHPGARSTGVVKALAGDGAADDESGDGDDILELTEAINEDGSTRRLAPIGSATRPPPGSAATGDEHLVSDGASLAAATALARLAAVTRTQRGLPMGGDHALDDVVRDLLRPLLQTWLDENLPDIVERLVQAEIARVVGKSGAA